MIMKTKVARACVVAVGVLASTATPASADIKDYCDEMRATLKIYFAYETGRAKVKRTRLEEEHAAMICQAKKTGGHPYGYRFTSDLKHPKCKKMDKDAAPKEEVAERKFMLKNWRAITAAIHDGMPHKVIQKFAGPYGAYCKKF